MNECYLGPFFDLDVRLSIPPLRFPLLLVNCPLIAHRKTHHLLKMVGFIVYSIIWL